MKNYISIKPSRRNKFNFLKVFLTLLTILIVTRNSIGIKIKNYKNSQSFDLTNEIMSLLNDGEMLNSETSINIQSIKQSNKNSLNNLVTNLPTEVMTKIKASIDDTEISLITKDFMNEMMKYSKNKKNSNIFQKTENMNTKGYKDDPNGEISKEIDYATLMNMLNEYINELTKDQIIIKRSEKFLNE